MSDPFAEFAVKDEFAEFEVDAPSRSDVLTDFSDAKADVATGNVPDTYEARKGRVASYIASDGTVDLGVAHQNADAFGRELIGNPKAETNEIFQEIASETDIGDAEQALNDVMEGDWVQTAEGYAIPSEPVDPKTRADILEQWQKYDMYDPVIQGYGRGFMPQWLMSDKEYLPPLSKGDVALEVAGEITGTITSLFGIGKALKGAGGVRAIPKVTEGLQRIGKVSPRLAIMTEQALSTFATIGGRSQFMSSSKDLKERAKNLGVDALVSAAFPVANEIAMIPKLGKAAVPAGAAAIFAAGTAGEDTLEGKIVGGTSLTAMWLISQGASYRQAKTVAKDVAKASGVKNPSEVVNSWSRMNIMRGARLMQEKQYMQGLIQQTAQGARAKAAAGQKLLPSETLAVAKANENAVVLAARSGQVAPIKADRAVLQSQAIQKAVVNGEFLGEDVAGKSEMAQTAAGSEPSLPSQALPVWYRGTAQPIEAFEGAEYFADSEGEATAYAELAVLRELVETNDELAEIAYDVLAENGGTELTDLSPETIHQIIEANDIDISVGDDVGVVSKVNLDYSNPLDVTELGSEISSKQELEATWNRISEMGLVEETRFDDFDEDVQAELAEQYVGKALYTVFDNESVYQKAFDQGYDAFIFTDQGVTGKTTHQTALVKDSSQIKPAPQAQEVAPEAPELPPEQVKEKYEMQVLGDAEQFGTPEDEVMKQLALVPSDEENADFVDNDTLPEILTPPPEDIDLTTEAGDSAFNTAVQGLTRIVENTANIFRRFGRQYVSDKPLAEQLEKSYHKISAMPHQAVLDVHNKLKEFPRTSKQDRTELTFALEADDSSDLPDRLLPIYTQLQQMFAEIEQMQVDAGVLQQTFEESHAQRIADIDKKIAKASGGKKDALVAEKRRLEQIKSYLPHDKVARAVMDEKMARSPVGAKKSFGKRLTQFHKQRKGTHSLSGYLEQGIVTEDDIDIVKLAMSAYTSGYHKMAVRGLIEHGKQNGYIIPEGEQVSNPDDWFIEEELHPIARVGGTDGMKVHRLFAQGLEEMGGVDGVPYNAWEKALAITKIGAFYRPDIIWKHNLSQSILGGTATINPLKLKRMLFDGVTAIQTKNQLWRDLDEAGLYQKTDIPTRVAVDELIQQMSNKTKLYANDKTFSKAVNMVSQALRMTPEEAKKIVDDKDLKKVFEEAVMSLGKISSSVTWYGDELQRTMSAISLMEKKNSDGSLAYTLEEAAAEAARIHVAYSNIGTKYKVAARKVLFVHAFRMLMPYELFLKPWINLTDQAYKKATGKKTDPKKAKRAAWVIFSTMAIPTVIDAWYKLHGWDVADEEERSGWGQTVGKPIAEIPLWNGTTADIQLPFAPHYKYSKKIQTPDGPKEIVSVVSTPNVILSRMGIRLTQQFPEKLDKEWTAQVENMAKSEINPLYANVWNFFKNEPLGYGQEPPRGMDGMDWVGGSGKMFKHTFKLWGALINLVETGQISQKDADTMLEDSMTTYENALRYWNFAYVRGMPEKRRIGMMFELKDAIDDGVREIQYLNVSDERKSELVKQLKATVQKSVDRLKQK